MSLMDFLTMVVSAGGAALVASWILERIPKYTGIASAETKRWIFFGICVVIALGAYAIITFVPSTVLQAIAPWFAIIAAVFSNVFLGTAFHKTDKLS